MRWWLIAHMSAENLIESEEENAKNRKSLQILS
jgi:hypothetical protein